MLAIVLKSLNVFLSRMYNGLSIINQVAPLPLSWRAQSGSVHSTGLAQGLSPPQSLAVLCSLISFLPGLMILASSV